MKLDGARTLLTGASGGIGRELAAQLAGKGARLVLVGRSRDALSALAARLDAHAMVCDLAGADDSVHEALVRGAVCRLGGLDLVVSAAGVSAFECIERMAPADIARMVATNLTSPMLLAAAALPHLQRGGRIVNLGSVLGALGMPYFSAYAATKFGLRGFSESLRREIAHRGIGVTYVAPRAVRTPMNTNAVHRYAALAKMPFDDPDHAAALIVRAIEEDASERTFGGAEPFYARLNGLWPRLFDRLLQPQARAGRQVLEAEHHNGGAGVPTEAKLS